MCHIIVGQIIRHLVNYLIIFLGINLVNIWDIVNTFTATLFDICLMIVQLHYTKSGKLLYVSNFNAFELYLNIQDTSRMQSKLVLLVNKLCRIFSNYTTSCKIYEMLEVIIYFFIYFLVGSYLNINHLNKIRYD